MNTIRKSLLVVLAAALALPAMLMPVQAQTGPRNAGPTAEIGNLNNRRLEGLWLATVTFEDEFSLKVLFNFFPGRDETEGTLIDANEFQLTPNPVCTADQGAWKQTNTNTYIATHFAFCFDATNDFEPDGTVKVRDNIVMNPKGTDFSGTQYIEIFDVDGVLVDTFEAEMTAVRINAEAPPPALNGRGTNASQLFQKLVRMRLERRR
jgi:hypothetical protein